MTVAATLSNDCILVTADPADAGARPFCDGPRGLAGFYRAVPGKALEEDDRLALCQTVSPAAANGGWTAIVLPDGRVLLGRGRWQVPGSALDVTEEAKLLRCRLK